MNHPVPLVASLGRRAMHAGFEIGVLYASPPETLRALKTAAALAADLDCRIGLICIQVVPYPLPLECPPVDTEFLAERLKAIAKEAEVPVEIHVYFGRDVLETLQAVLHPDTVLVIGSKDQGWNARPGKLVRRLLKRGHSVVLAGESRRVWNPLLGKLEAFGRLPATGA